MPSSVTDPLCPRCDYDLQGEVATWKNECPLNSRCPECGLDVHWPDVYRIVPPPTWSVEHAEGPRLRVCRFAIASGVRAFVPRHLWRRLSLAMPVVPARLVLMGILWFLGSYLFSAALMAATIWVEAWLDQRVIAALIVRYPQYANGYSSQILPPSIWYEPARWLFPYFRIGNLTLGIPPQPAAMCVFLVFVVPVTLFLMPLSLRRAKVRSRHLFRLTAYWLLWAPIFAIIPAWTDSLYRMSYAIQGIVAYSAPVVTIPPGTPPAPPPRPSLFEQLVSFIQAHSSVTVGAILFLLVFWFWRNATRHYLRLPRPEVVAFAITTLSMLVMAAAGYFVLRGGDSVVMQIFIEIIGK
jgi:hypothetical protein